MDSGRSGSCYRNVQQTLSCYLHIFLTGHTHADPKCLRWLPQWFRQALGSSQWSPPCQHAQSHSPEQQTPMLCCFRTSCVTCNDHCLSALALGRWHWLPPSQHAQSHSPGQQTSTQMLHPHKLCHMCNDHCWSTSMALAPGS